MNYGVIGNCKSAALVDAKGTINWCCMPDFDSASIFASILDENRGGHWSIKCDDSYKVTQKYIKNTNILETVFKNKNNAFKVTDFMPRYKIDSGTYHAPAEVVRYIETISGKPKITFDYQPKLGYAKHATYSEVRRNYIKSFVKEGDYESIYLYTNADKANILDGKEIEIVDDIYLVLSYHQKLLKINTETVNLDLERTKVYWMDWIQRSIDFDKYVQPVRRSALVLKLLSYQETGAILAAITTSLPETVGEERNWDYRFCWIRDSSMILKILTKLGHYNVAKNFFEYIMQVIPFKNDKIQIMYRIRGQKDITEEFLDWLDGYKGSKPVRIGNAAVIQKQNDIYGLLLDGILHYIEYFKNDVLSIERLWTITRTLVRNVCEHWREPDMGIWEFRNKTSHLVFSKVLCWVALDRGAKIAELLNCMDHYEEWCEIRNEIKVDIMEKGWNEELGAFSQSYGNNAIDAANLLFVDYGFIEPDHPYFVSTVRVTKEQLCKDGLMFRYKNDDDFGSPKSSFTACSFWMVKALWNIGEKDEANGMYEKLLSYRNHLGLLSEDLDFTTKELLGNFPQGYSHLALIDCAMALSREEINEESELIGLISHQELVQK